MIALEWSQAVEPMTALSSVVSAAKPAETRTAWVHRAPEDKVLALYRSAAEVERDFFKHARPTSLLQRFESPDEIAALTAFIASPRASGVNGAALRVDGGVVRAIG